MSFDSPRTILITGASSGLGAELARQYAARGITLFLGARNRKRLEEVAKQCRERGAYVITKHIDVKESSSVSGWVSSADSERALDLVIANAGISAGTGGGGENLMQVKNIFDTNIDGVISTVCPAASFMQKRKKGQIAIISSLAGYRGLPSSPAYSASKAAVRVYGEGLRGFLSKYNVGVSVVTPGYIKTPMTQVNDFPMPFLMNVERAAAVIRRKLVNNPARIAFPLPLYFAVWFSSILPPWLTDPIFERLPSKPNSAIQKKEAA